jgi:hypothetical protein
MIDTLLARLEANARPPLRQVEGAGEYAALTAPPPLARQPAAFVIPLTETGGPNNLAAGPVRQRIAQTFGVVLLLGNLRDARGQSAAAALVGVQQAVRAALIGFQPTADHDPIEFRRGQLIDIAEGALAWQDEFETAITMRYP